MLKTISDKFFSLWPNHTNNIDKVSAGSKRKRRSDECDVNDVDPDLHLSSVEKKRRTETANTFVDTIKTSVSNMAQWLRPSSKRYSDEFNIIPIVKRENTPTSHNGDSIKVPHLLDNRNFTNHRLGVQHNTSNSNGLPSNGIVDDGIGQNVSRRTSRSSVFQPHKTSTASLCIRLKEKEEYKKLLKLQSQRSPWQQQSFGIPYTSSTTNESDVISISSESSGDKTLQRQCSTLMETKPTQAAFSIPKHKMTPNSSNSAYIQISNSKSLQTKSLLATLHEQRQKYKMGISFRKPVVAAHEGCIISSSRNKEDPYMTRAKIIDEKNNRSPHKHSEAIVVIDDDEDSGGGGSGQITATAFDTKSAATQKDSKPEKVTDVRIKPSFLQSRFIVDNHIEDDRRARIEEQKRRKCQIEEEEMKAKAYAEKRRAQEISLDRSLKYQMRIFDDEPQVCEEIFRDEEEEEEDKLPELTPEMQQVIDGALRPGSPQEVLSEEFRLQITRGDIKTLSGLNWLNDEVVNFYMNLLMKSGENGERAKLYAFNTFFYPKVKAGGHAAVKRWTKNVNLFAVNYIIIPVHLSVHWCLCVADMKKKVITYYDSMGAKNNQCLQAVLQYIQDESKAKNYTAFVRTEWKLVNAEDNPQQMNAGDCGMFMCMYAEYITRGKEITFTQEHMPYFRRRMVYEIISKKLLQ